MKLNEKVLKEMIREVLNENPAAETARSKKVASGMDTGGRMTAEEYLNTARSALMEPNISPPDRRQALETLFPKLGLRIDTMIKNEIEQAKRKEQQGAG
tara:strand:- start:1182 stop:1478 length:297 start_codon:yes stop_codon:yes gene_type:complete